MTTSDSVGVVWLIATAVFWGAAGWAGADGSAAGAFAVRVHARGWADHARLGQESGKDIPVNTWDELHRLRHELVDRNGVILLLRRALAERDAQLASLRAELDEEHGVLAEWCPQAYAGHVMAAGGVRPHGAWLRCTDNPGLAWRFDQPAGEWRVAG